MTTPSQNDVLAILNSTCRDLYGKADAAETRFGKTDGVSAARGMISIALQLAYASKRHSHKCRSAAEHDDAAMESTKAVFVSCDLIDSANMVMNNTRGGFAPSNLRNPPLGTTATEFEAADDYQRETLVRRYIVESLPALEAFLCDGDYTLIEEPALRFLNVFVPLAGEPHADLETAALRALRVANCY